MSDGMRRELVYLSSHATNRYFIPNWGSLLNITKIFGNKVRQNSAPKTRLISDAYRISPARQQKQASFGSNQSWCRSPLNELCD